MKPIYGTVTFGRHAHHMPIAVFLGLFSFIETWQKNAVGDDHLGVGFLNRSHSRQYFWVDTYPLESYEPRSVSFQSSYQPWEAPLTPQQMTEVITRIREVAECDSPDANIDTVIFHMDDKQFIVLHGAHSMFIDEPDAVPTPAEGQLLL